MTVLYRIIPINDGLRVSLSPDAKISLDAYPNVLSWMERIKQLSGYIAIA
ncbi:MULTISPECIES: hypothetical protein [unclassified Moorena]|nr:MULTISPECIES: hypothetical protein [unclassified Moorena]